MPVLEAGERVFGENKVQEAWSKWPELKRLYPDVELHLIGPLQTNKAREAVEFFDVIETLDRPKLAAALAKEIARCGRASEALCAGEYRRGAAEGGRSAARGRCLHRELPQGAWARNLRADVHSAGR